MEHKGKDTNDIFRVSSFCIINMNFISCSKTSVLLVSLILYRKLRVKVTLSPL